MRHACLLAILVGCTADIGSGSYYCGPDELCPDEQVCDGASNTCVTPAVATAYSCPAPTVTAMLPARACVSPLTTAASCLASATDRARYVFDVPAGCTTVVASASVSFPLAFAPVAISILADGNDASASVDTPCLGATGAGEGQRCITATVAAGARYELDVGLDPSAPTDCGGDCAFNRYTVTFQLGTP